MRYLLGAENWSIQSVFAYLAKVTGLPEPRWRVPYSVALAAAYVSEFVADTITGRIPAATVTGVKLTRRRMHFDATRSLAELGIVPRPVRESIARGREVVPRGAVVAVKWRENMAIGAHVSPGPRLRHERFLTLCADHFLDLDFLDWLVAAISPGHGQCLREFGRPKSNCLACEL